MQDLKEIIPITAGSSTAIAALLKNPDILKMIYKDALQPSVKKVGKALDTILGLGTTALLPLQMLNEKTNILFCRHMENFKKRLENIPESEICEVPSEIGIPIIERLTFIQDDNIADMFISLLEKSSKLSTSLKVHPVFLNIINNLSPDDAVLLKNLVFDYLRQGINKVPYIYIKTVSADNKGYMNISGSILAKSTLLGLKNQESYPLFLDNLITLGLYLKHDDKYLTNIERFYLPIENENVEFIEDIRNSIVNSGRKVEIGRGMLEITKTGESFIDAIGLGK